MLLRVSVYALIISCLFVLAALCTGSVLPDNQMTFTHFPNDENTAVTLLDIEAGIQFDVFNRKSASVDFVSWSPDGARLMFLSSPGLLALDVRARALNTVAYGYNM
jgi:hypothetical protein